MSRSNEGWQPWPLCQFILKIHSRCDLRCDYCYVYEMADQSWKEQPRRVSKDVIAHTAFRIAEHAHAHRMPSVHLILHGGEPLLAGADHIAHTVRAVRQALGPSVRLDVSLQTNGMRLDETYLKLFDDLGIRVGVSMDGSADDHDRHRRRPDGSGSHATVSAALDLLTERYLHLYGGLLCTVDLDNDPLTTYEALLRSGPPRIDFLLPHGNWAEPPPGLPAEDGATPYADWLIPIFDRWYGAARRETEVRLFADILHLLMGGTSSSETLGLGPARMVVIEADGGIQQSDTLKSAYPGAPVTGFHVARDTFDAVLRHPAVMTRQLGAEALAKECRDCPVLSVCGGGLYAHRYDPDNGFGNRSVYCDDLFRLIDHIRGEVRRDVATLLEGRR
ncbi:FxsB family cyclophane-forming radical SAM/SPASM peptide maturase [Nonomuraea sp. NEAU-A123]|uniref:FxsB family cyclophane-forming radical SAM/SPASM peptide maturase n=1 Tax=Nonomuraea sp. NEAU-A123 TaxID=2839649 RepID=UPI001BE432B0|nr:FxsB family cyclophane-forming radical SAM/SPASM peptide maturase [Nonomuraea sp. NEAU-A123]MBT2227900.1 FxsB family radical SAM/SPASM domain protein [Nonomuraea sp. NEAU-A123]